jgi:hypothetical protein
MPWNLSDPGRSLRLTQRFLDSPAALSSDRPCDEVLSRKNDMHLNG